MPNENETNNSNDSQDSVRRPLPLTSKIGATLIGVALLVVLLNYFPIVKQEIGYVLKKSGGSVFGDKLGTSAGALKQIVPVDTEFGIVIPKINANAKVITDVNPLNSVEYQISLTKGVAHAKGTPKPGEPGNVFLFAHSSDNFFNANTYNSVFYLVHRLELGDKFEIYYKGQKFEYEIIEKSIVEATRVDYMKAQEEVETVTLMTCWPPGTTLKRLVVVGKRSQ